MAGAFVYMIALLAMGSGMAVLMFGFSSTHSSMYTLQKSFDEHEKMLQRAHQADLDASAQLSGLRSKVEELHTESEKVQATASKETQNLVKSSAELRQDLSRDVRDIKMDIEKLRDKQKVVTTEQDDIRLQTQTQKASADATSERVSELERKLNLLSTKQLALADHLESQEKAQLKLQGLLESLTRTVEELGHQHATEGTQLEDVRQKLHDAQAVTPSMSSSSVAEGSASSEVKPPEVAVAVSPSPPPLETSAGSSAVNSTGESSSSAGHDIQDATTGHEGVDSDLHASAYRRTPDVADDETEPSTSPSPPPAQTPSPTPEQTEQSTSPAPVQTPSPTPEPVKPSTSPSPAPPPAASIARQPLPAASSTRKAQGLKAPAAHPSPPAHKLLKAYSVSWYRECGCTGMEIEAVTLLAALVEKLGAGHVRTNKCTDTCVWSASTRSMLDSIETPEESQLTELPRRPSKPGAPTPKVVLVIHAAFSGVCGIPDSLLLPQRSPRDPVSDAQRGLYRVSRSMLETDRVDKDAARTCNEQFDAVWVPSKFNVQSFSKSGVKKNKLQVLHEAVDTSVFKCQGSKKKAFARFGVPELDDFLSEIDRTRDFTFLSVFKWESRKNWKALLETFHQTFPQGVMEVASKDGKVVKGTVRLLIKTQELSWGSPPESDLQEVLRDMGAIERTSFSMRVLIFKGPLSSQAMPRLYHAADAFVLPTHGEGWGLPLMEAMASGLPTIATNWGGNTEFMTKENSWLLAYDLVYADIFSDEEERGGGRHLWAEPWNSNLKQAMQEVVSQREAAHTRAQRGCHEVHKLFTPQAVAQHAIDLITHLPSVVSH